MDQVARDLIVDFFLKKFPSIRTHIMFDMVEELEIKLSHKGYEVRGKKI